MNREEAIQAIEALYPADDERTAEIGKQLLAQAQYEVGLLPLNWRSEPTRVLIRYAELCERKEKELWKNY